MHKAASGAGGRAKSDIDRRKHTQVMNSPMRRQHRPNLNIPAAHTDAVPLDRS